MTTLHIEHPISDVPTWPRAFSRFEEARRRAGVRAERVLQPIDDDKYIYVDLDFDNVEQAAAFQEFLRRTCGPPGRLRQRSPALRGRASYEGGRRAICLELLSSRRRAGNRPSPKLVPLR